MALLLFAAVIAIQLRSILRSQEPRLRAIRAMGTGVPLLLVIFASAYCIVAAQQPEAFSEPVSRTDALYFTVTVVSTVGMGDIAPVTDLARVLVTIQMLTGLITVGVVAKLVVGSVRVAVARRARAPERVGEDGGHRH